MVWETCSNCWVIIIKQCFFYEKKLMVGWRRKFLKKLCCCVGYYKILCSKHLFKNSLWWLIYIINSVYTNNLYQGWMNFSRVQYFCFVLFIVCYLLSSSTVPSSELSPTTSTKRETATKATTATTSTTTTTATTTTTTATTTTTTTATTTRASTTSDKTTRGKLCDGKRKMWSSISWNEFYNFP